MDSCGFIYFFDSKTNIQDTITICAYAARRTEDISDSDEYVKYCLDKSTLKIKSKSDSFERISYTTLMELAGKAVELDKSVSYPMKAEFHTDSNGGFSVRVCGTCKEIFPLPCKQDTYFSKKLYAGITQLFTPEPYLSVLGASLICELINYAALCDGFADDRLFAHSCGRIFADASCLSGSTEGRKLLARLAPGFDFKRYERRLKPVRRLRMNRYDISPGELCAESFANDFLKIHTESIFALRKLHIHVADIAENAASVARLANDELESFMPAFIRMAWNGAADKPEDFRYASFSDLLDACLPGGWDRIKYTIEQNRKFFNASKKRGCIFALCFDGGIEQSGEI